MPIVKGYGTIDSIGVLPAGQTSPVSTTEVEFSVNIYRSGRSYQGELYLVDYDTREKVNSNRLIYFEESSSSQVVCIFIVECGNGNCSYQVIVTVSPSNCTSRCNGKFYAYVPAIYNQGLNVGGNLKSGEIKTFGNDCCYDYSYNPAFASNGTIVSNSAEENECTFYDTSDSTNGCCSNRSSSS